MRTLCNVQDVDMNIPECGFDNFSLAGTEGRITHKSSLSGFLQLGYYAAISQKVGISFFGFWP